MTNDERIAGMTAQVQRDLDHNRKMLNYYRSEISRMEERAQRVIILINRDKALTYRLGLTVDT